ncbi:hypothetical protein CPT_MTx_022 [Serratia phage MTx]|uniref:Uncharacterized protein n=1 Tax=Serratia phage MTx TaxID=2557553 RepID=A0A482MGF5_9CAUD|nr:hypothetical protein HWC15_gp022 [Serratia phage MTx]QBQ72328.1 hypothetical protein CPT_MTx_022 [Serratia phage MTx]
MERENADLERIKAKIAKLLNLAERASNEHEAANAMAKARAMMDKFQLTQLDALDVGGNTIQFTKVVATRHFAAMPEYMAFLATAVAKFNDVQAQYDYGFVNFKKKEGDAKKFGKAIEFRGMADDVNIAVDMYARLLGAINNLCTMFLAREGYDGKYPVKIGTRFKLGAVMTLCDRFNELQRERDALKTSNGTGLVVVKGAAVAEYFGEVSYKEKAPSATKRMDGESSNAYHQGRRDGNKVEIQRHINQ